MGGFVTAKVEGLSQMRRDLDALGDGAMLGDAMREVEQIVSDAADALVPVRSGKLRSRTRGSSNKFRARVSNSLVYAAPIHWGWPGRFGAQPWLTQAAEASEPLWLGVVQEAVQDSLDRVRGA